MYIEDGSEDGTIGQSINNIMPFNFFIAHVLKSSLQGNNKQLSAGTFSIFGSRTTAVCFSWFNLLFDVDYD